MPIFKQHSFEFKRACMTYQKTFRSNKQIARYKMNAKKSVALIYNNSKLRVLSYS